MSKKTLLLVILIGILVGAGLACAATQLRIPTAGNITGEINLQCTPQTIEWDSVTLNTPVIRSVNITNVGTRNVATLNMTYENPSTNLLDYTVTWDCEAQPLPHSAWVIANFTLTITDGTEGPFSFDISIQE